MITKRFFIVVALLLIGAAGLCADDKDKKEYKDDSGFSFTYPSDWILVTSERVKDVQAGTSEDLKKWIEKNKIDLSQVKVILLSREPKKDQSLLENLNVVINPEQITLDKDSVKKLLEGIPKVYEGIGAKIEELKSQVEKVGANEALIVDYKLQLPVLKTPLQLRQYFLPWGGKSLIVTCTSTPETFEKYSPQFQKILESVKLPSKK